VFIYLYSPNVGSINKHIYSDRSKLSCLYFSNVKAAQNMTV